MAKDEKEIPRHPTAAERLKKHLKLHKGRPDVLKAIKHRERIRKHLEPHIELAKVNVEKMKAQYKIRAEQKVIKKANTAAVQKELQDQLDKLVAKEEIEVIS